MNEGVDAEAHIHACEVIRHVLDRHHLAWRSPELPYPPAQSVMVLINLVDIFLTRHGSELEKLMQAFPLTNSTDYLNFSKVAEELFGGTNEDGTLKEIRWGRIVALYAFGGLIAKKCWDTNNHFLTYPTADWLGVFTEIHLDEFIQENGGWDSLQTHWQNDLAASFLLVSWWRKAVRIIKSYFK
jgi:hypothetical protein